MASSGNTKIAAAMEDKVVPAVPSVPPVKSVWGVPLQSNQDLPSLNDVMSEQLAKDLLEKEEQTELKKILDELQLDDEMEAGAAVAASSAGFEGEAEDEDDTDCADDLLIAQMLQLQFDQEYDDALEKEVNHVNGSKKLTISYSKYKMIPLPFWDDESDEDEEDEVGADDRNRDLDSYETADKEMGIIPRCGYKKVGGTIVTKHDREMSERSNGRRMMEFPPGIDTGDGAALNGPQIQVSNAVYNKIRNFSIKEGKRQKRVHDKIEKSTSDQAVDPTTRLLLFKMINNGYLESIHGIISTGKEAIIIYADGGPGPDDAEVPLNIPKEVAIKVFKTTLNEFKNREKYIRDDYRFRDRFSKQNPRKVIHMWAEKEMHNLLKMAKFGILVPDVVLLRKHILLMSFIGHDGKPAPKLKDAQLSEEEVELAYNQTIQMMNRLYNEVHLVHADLSEFNILWHEGQCWFIDVSQAVEPNHPHGLEFLFRDCRNISEFFSSRGVPQCLSPPALFTSITGLPIDESASEAEILIQVLNYVKHEEILGGKVDDEVDAGGCNNEKNDPFEYCWEQSKTPRTPSRPIPGHTRSKSGSSGGKSPKSPKSGGFCGSKSPKTPPMSSPNLAGLTDDELKRMKEELMRQKSESEGELSGSLHRKESQVKFSIADDEN